MNPWIIAAIVVIALGAAWIYRGTRITAPVPIITLGLVIALAYGVVSYDAQLATQRARSDCLSRVDRSAGNRTMWVALGQYLVERGNADGAAVLTKLLDANLPLLDAKDCPP